MAKLVNNRPHNILGTTMENGLQMNLKDAIEDVGVQVPNSACLWEYPEIIRKNLISKTVSSLNIKGTDIISVTNDDNGTFVISTAIDTNKYNHPNYAASNSNWGDTMTADEVFDDLFANILPNVRGIHAADISTTDPDGNDTTEWYNSLFNARGFKKGLKENSKYLRIYLTCQSEPLFVYIDALVTNLTNGYNVKNSSTVEFELNDIDKTLTAHVACITSSQLETTLK